MPTFLAARATVMVGVLVVSGCRAEPEQDTSEPRKAAPAVAAGCPESAPSLTGWDEVSARHAPIRLLVPRGAARTEASGQDYSGEIWISDGASVAYYLSPAGPGAASSSSSMEDHRTCSEAIGGKPAKLDIYYADQVYAPGQYVVGYWSLPGGKELAVKAHARDRGKLSELVTALRGVRFGN
jgi:hypothetical protein